MTQKEIADEAIQHAIKALHKRSLLEERAHGPAFSALSKPLLIQGSEWKDKAEKLEIELQQCYKAQSRLSEQLVVEVAESRAFKALVQEKESTVADLQNELAKTREENSHLKVLLEEKTKALELLIDENQGLRTQLDKVTITAEKVEAENKVLIDRWMLQKMQEAERMNEANAIYEDMLDRMKATSIEKLARQQVDGMVRQFEEGAEFYVESTIPSTCKNRIPAHEGGCAAICFENGSTRLITGGQDQTVKLWDTNSCVLTQTLHGCLGSVLDLTITHDNRSIIASTTSNNLFMWDVNSGRMQHTLTGHTEKACAVDASKGSNRLLVSAAYDRTIKLWDIQRGYCINTIMFSSNCNTVGFAMDGRTVCSGHADGNLRVWDIQSGKLVSEVAAHSAAHSAAITSISLSRSGNVVVTSGRDNVHNLFDMRSLEVCGTLRWRNGGNKLASNWSRSCMSPDEKYVASGSADGWVCVWSVSEGGIVSSFKDHGSAVLSCSWSGVGKPLASADKSGTVCVWT